MDGTGCPHCLLLTPLTAPGLPTGLAIAALGGLAGGPSAGREYTIR
jgi:hypothetical protein